MILPTFPQLHYAMHLLGGSLVELFPKLQLLDMEVYPDRVLIDFSFARELSLEELAMIKTRFLQKAEAKAKGDIREMVSKNAADLLKYHNQIFLTDLVDREEMFAPMFCMDPYHAPLYGELDQKASFSDIKLDMLDFGPKKWMKRKVHHYRLDAMIFFHKSDRKKWESLALKKDHRKIGEEEALFFVEDGLQFFTGKGEAAVENFIDVVAKGFGEKVFFDGDAGEFFELTGVADFYAVDEVSGDYGEICYGLKEAEQQRVLSAWTFSQKDVKKTFDSLMEELSFSGAWGEGEFFLHDFLGVPWKIAEMEERNKYFTITINLQCLFAIHIEKKLVE